MGSVAASQLKMMQGDVAEAHSGAGILTISVPASGVLAQHIDPSNRTTTAAPWCALMCRRDDHRASDMPLHCALAMQHAPTLDALKVLAPEVSCC